jgi:predicted helicase
MFAARLHDPTLPTFSRQEAAELIPKTNPFLRKLFGYIAGPDIDDRIKWIVDSLVDIFLACNVREILKNYGKSTKMEDPIIHFYETFLSEYDPKLRKARGVWYTPQPVVDFIVRAVDDILKSEFGLKEGLADTSKTKIKVNLQATDKRYKANIKTVEEEVHRVQILDPATGTGTFLAEVVKHIHKKFEGQEGIWSNYVETHLLPRLNGFELLMASYAMAHLKLDLLLTETGFKPKKEQRLRVYLTNSLEESHPDTGTLFANWLSSEANEANRIKRETPVMVVIGNPPYSISSTNKGAWIENLISDYKTDLNEKNIQALSDDYVKFIRYGQHFVDKNGTGILAYISNNSFLDGIIHRQMRRNLLQSFDKIFILDLHGNAKKKESDLSGKADQNVFDIMQGVSINIFVKTGRKKKNELSQVFHSDSVGSREEKYINLNTNELKDIQWQRLDCIAPQFYFVRKNFEGKNDYNQGFKINELFKLNANGIKTQRDDASISFTIQESDALLSDFKNLDEEALRIKYNYVDVRDWKISFAQNDIKQNPIISRKILYRPFDLRAMIYTGKTKGIMGYPRLNVMRHMITEKNYGLILVSQPQAANLNFFDSIFITDCIADTNMYRRGGPSVFPLYFYSAADDNPKLIKSVERLPNFDQTEIKKIAEHLKLKFTNEKGQSNNVFCPLDLLEYIYAILHSNNYREKYKEFLKIDFPRIPYPKDPKKFWQLVELGGELRQLHLLESLSVQKYITKYPVDGDNIVGKIKYENGNVLINDSQYFANVPEIAWNFYIGGYQPAQKWLKDRKDRELSYDDILHYQKIIVALTETDRIMKEIDLVGVE